MIQTDDKLDISVENIMTKEVFTVDVNDKMLEVKKMMAKNHIRHAPVLRGGKLVGILSLTDVQRMGFSSTYGEQEAEIDGAISDMFNAEMVMHSNPETINNDHTIREAAQKFLHRDFHALPVMKESDLVGIVTTTDILKHLLK